MIARTTYVSVFLISLMGCFSDGLDVRAQDAPTVTVEDLAFLVGSWDGSLEYLNFGDDKTLVTLPTRAVFAQNDSEISYQFVYTEPNGSEVNGEGTIDIEEGNRVNYNGASHSVVSKSVDLKNDTIEIRLTHKGMDNNREAQIDHVFQRKGEVVTITRFILLDGATDPFVRHTYTFNRIE